MNHGPTDPPDHFSLTSCRTSRSNIYHTSSFSSDLSVLILCEQELRWERNHKRRKEKIRTRLQSGESGSDFLSLVPAAGVEPARYRYHWILSPARLPIPSRRLMRLGTVSIIQRGQKKIKYFSKFLKKRLAFCFGKC